MMSIARRYMVRINGRYNHIEFRIGWSARQSTQRFLDAVEFYSKKSPGNKPGAASITSQS